jgi:ABC-2 type transport system permease protein
MNNNIKVVYALWLRQLKRYFRNKYRIIGSLGQPLLFLVALGFGFGPIYAAAGGGDYIQFLVPGIMAMTILFTSMFAGMEIIWARQFGFLKETLVAPVSRTRIMIGRTLGGTTIALFQALMILIISMFFGFKPDAAMLPLALLFMILTSLLFTALGTAIATHLNDMQGFQIIMNFLVMPLFFLSGALFPLDGMPTGIKAITFLNPLTYGVDGIRGSLTHQVSVGLAIDFGVLIVLTTVLIIIGSYLFSKIEV